MNEVLKVFVEVAQQLNFTRAAQRLHITQPAVSQHIRGLEEDLGAVLFDRTNRTVRLTRAGEVVYEHARRMLQTEQQMRRVIEDVSGAVRGPLRIGASYTIGEYILPSIVAEFWELYPDVEPHIEIENTHDVAEAVANRRLDLGLIEGSIGSLHGNSGINVEEIARDELVLIAGSRQPFAGNELVSPEELSKAVWIVREEGSGTREFTDRVFEAYGIRPRRMMTFSSTQAVKEAVQSGLGIALISAWTIRTELQLRTIRVVRFSASTLSRSLSLVTQPKTLEAHTAHLFSDFLRERFLSQNVFGRTNS